MTQGIAIKITSLGESCPRRTILHNPVPWSASLNKCKDTQELSRELEGTQNFTAILPLLTAKYRKWTNKVYKITQQLICLDTWHLLWLGFSMLPPAPATAPFLLPRGKTPGSMKVAMLKFASTNKKTSPLYTGMAGEMAFVNQGHLWRRKAMGKGSFSCNTVSSHSLPSHRSTLGTPPPPAMQQGWICNVIEISREPVSVITAIPSVKLLCSRAQKAQIVHRAHRALPPYCLICNLAFYYSV